jgi:hypothetical protein
LPLPFIIAARNARELMRMARTTLDHFRALPAAEQERLRGHADIVKTLSSELAVATAQSVKGRVSGSAAETSERGAKDVAAELRDAIARLSDATAQEVATIAKGESRKVRYAGKAVGFGARRLDRGSREKKEPGE